MLRNFLNKLARRNMCPVKRRAIELLEQDDVAAAQVSESYGAGNVTVFEIKAVKGRAFRASPFV